VLGCPQCKNDVWDNREKNATIAKTGGKMRPDFSCRDRNCGWCVWQGGSGGGGAVVAPPVVVDSGGGPVAGIVGVCKSTQQVCKKCVVGTICSNLGLPGHRPKAATAAAAAAVQSVTPLVQTTAAAAGGGGGVASGAAGGAVAGIVGVCKSTRKACKKCVAGQTCSNLGLPGHRGLPRPGAGAGGG
jgi:hypothetical protein